MTYIIPIVDQILNSGTHGRGIQAIIVYPMNALVNSQAKALENYLPGGDKGQPPVTFQSYTGQETKAEKASIIDKPPDILLTNYVMLELILTRRREQRLLEGCNLRFLVLDELHTYRGRQGADVALLVRRVRDRLAPEPKDRLQCVGTSATLASDGPLEEQCANVAKMASKLFGTTIRSGQVIQETLTRTTSSSKEDEGFKQHLRARIASGNYAPPHSYDDFLHDPLSTWIEDTYGVQEQEGRFIRTKPLSIHDGAKKLAEETGLSERVCRKAIQEWLVVGSHDISDPKTDKHPFAFRLHQFISKGDTVYASLGHEEQRYLTLQKQTYVPRKPEEPQEEYKRDCILLPLVFCRECGQEYYSVVDEGDCFVSRELNVQIRTEGRLGYLYPNLRDPWPGSNIDPKERLPEDWLEVKLGGETRVRRAVSAQRPTLVYVRPDGYKVDDDMPGTLPCYFVPAPFRFCLHCDVSYNQRQKNDFAKLSTLSSEGRSTATTILSLAAIRLLNEANVGIDEARHMAAKMLSFTDNRQDASLQAGHFNDFVEIGLLRAGLYKAVTAAGQAGIRHEDLTMRIFRALNLSRKLYAIEPDVKYQAKEETDRAFRNVLGYRLYRDLKRGWRITSPNLEQCDLLSIDYLSLDDICEDEEIWQGCHETLSMASPATRKKVAKTLLDHMRRELAIKVDYLNLGMQESIQQQSNQRLVTPWALDENETRQEYASILFPKKKEKEDYRGNLYLSGLSGFGAYIRRPSTFNEYTDKPKLNVDEAQEIIVQLLEGLRKGGLVERVVDPRDKDDPGGFQLPAATIIWKAGEGKHPPYDPIRVPRRPKVQTHVNQFFFQFYRTDTQALHEVEAREHTAQVPGDERKERENKFRDGELPILYCSPTMELGIDIRDLNVVNMRNIPPTPANYAQRSGRAGRGGQPALVFSYCSTGSAHDQYFFRRPEQMVRGAVTPPRLDLANEDLIRAHIHAIWLAETQLELPDSLKDLLDVTPSSKKMPLLPPVRAKIEQSEVKRRALDAARRIMERQDEDWHQATWFTENWLDEVLNRVVENFDMTCDRWRTLYQAAQSQFDAQNDIIRDASRSAGDKQKAVRLRGEAESQLSLLTSDVEHLEQQQSDFYSYRYFATEGFLPGYNFPRLPLSAYIPARRTKQRDRDAYLSRPRFLAISEFAPRAIVYHEGSRYVINRVILSVNEDGGGITTSTAKQCKLCGYLHPNSDVQSFDICENCGSSNLTAIYQLFRLQNVATRRRDKINSDEEERMRQGYQIRTAIRFSEREGHLERYNAVAILEEDEEKKVLKLSYGSAATIWRINFGWWRNKDEQKSGFRLDFERGYWGKDDEEITDDQGDEMSQRVKRVIPFVEDRRNCLLLELTHRLDTESMASLQAALKNALQVKYQLEDNELAAEPLPDDADRKLLLFYEASEGGAGVLRRLIDEPEALSEVAQVALDLCHYAADGSDLFHAPGVTENCETACYYCLMTYANQRDHRLLDRKKVLTILRVLAQTKVHLSTTEQPRARELLQLTQQSTFDIEQKWLQMLQEGGYRLPSATHKSLDFCTATPDFLYEEQQIAIYIDGDGEQYPERFARDSAERDILEDYGYMILRFGALEDWAVIFTQNPYIFGRGT